MLVSLLVYVFSLLGLGDFHSDAKALLINIDVNKTLLHGMLSFLLFAGALHVNLSRLKGNGWLLVYS